MRKNRNYTPLLLVFGAFLVMVLASYLFIRRVLWNRLLESAGRALFATEERIRSSFAEAEFSLINTCRSVQEMVDAGAPQEELLLYLEDITAWLRQQEEGELRLFGVYGYVRGAFVDSMGLKPGQDYIPQQRPWYQAAVRSGGKTAYTAPYVDARTGEIIVSAVRNLTNSRGNIDGILAVDMDISRLNEYVKNLSLSRGGYGILLSQNMTVVTHREAEYRGRLLEDLGEDYEELSRRLRIGESVSAGRIRDSGREQALAFFSPLFNGWYVGLITPQDSFYQDLYSAGLILSILGLSLALALGAVLFKLESDRLRSDEENQAKSSFLARKRH
jgi:hypothetical protein